MNLCGLSHTDFRTYVDTLARSHRMRARVVVLTHDERPWAELTAPDSRILDGQVTVDATADVSRSLSLTVLDPDRRLHLDPGSPSRTALFADNFIRVERGDYVDALGRFVYAPVFWGPVTKFERRGHTVTVEAQGKESLLQEPALLWRDHTYRKGVNVGAAIRAIAQLAGEARFGHVEGTARLPHDLSLTRHDPVWPALRKLARSVNLQLFYDGAGVLRLRAHPSKSTYTFRAITVAGYPPPTVLSQPQVTYDFTEVRNLVEVLGPEPKAKQPRIRYVAVAPRAHPLSPWSLGRGGTGRYLVEQIQADQVRRTAEAKAIGDRVLADKLKIGVAVQFDALPVPCLEEGDLLSLTYEAGTISFRADQYVIPLTATAAMSVGDLKRMSVARRRKS